MVLLGSNRRAARRSLRAVEELGADGRLRLRSLLTNSCLVVWPTSSVVDDVTSRLAPGSVTLGVASTASLGIDQTLGVTEVLTARGYDVRPHLAASLVENGAHLTRTLRRLRSVSSVLLVAGNRQAGTGLSVLELAAAIADNHASVRIGIGATAQSGDGPAEAVLAASAAADWISTRTAADPRRMLAWAAEMRVRGMEPPIELGIPGLVRLDTLRRDHPHLSSPGGSRGQWFDPTSVATTIAKESALDRLAITGLRIDTLNLVDETAGWRQRLFDLAAPVREI